MRCNSFPGNPFAMRSEDATAVGNIIVIDVKVWSWLKTLMTKYGINTHMYD